MCGLMTCNIRFLFFFNDTATTEIYTLSLHDALPIYLGGRVADRHAAMGAFSRGRHSEFLLPFGAAEGVPAGTSYRTRSRSEEHTSELQSRQYLVCRLLLEKKKMILRLSLSIRKIKSI